MSITCAFLMERVSDLTGDVVDKISTTVAKSRRDERMKGTKSEDLNSSTLSIPPPSICFTV